MVAQRVTKTTKGVRKYASQTQRLGKLSNVYCCSTADLLRSHQMIVPCSKAVPSFVRVMLSPAGPGASSAGSSSQPSWSVMQRAFGHLLSGDEVPLGPTACLPSAVRAAIQHSTWRWGRKRARQDAGGMRGARRRLPYSRMSFKASLSPSPHDLQTPILGAENQLGVSVGGTGKLQHLFSEPARRGRQ